MLNCFVPKVCPPRCAATVTCQVPPLGSWIEPSYSPLPLSASGAATRSAAIPMAGIAGIKKVAVTCAPVKGFPSELITFTRTVFAPWRGELGSVLKSMLTCEAGAAPGAAGCGVAGAKAPAAACSCASESTRKFAELTTCSPAFSPLRTTVESSICAPVSIVRGSRLPLP